MQKRPSKSQPRGKRILIVEDDAGARQSLRLLLEIDRHAVTEAENAEEALGEFQRTAFDLVIVDYFMAGMRGDELARRLKQMSPSQPVLMVSAYTEKLRPEEKPVDGVIGKPFSINDLRQALAKLLPE